MRTTKYFSLLLLIFLAISSAALAQVSVGVSLHIGPPPLPVYTQPLCPAPGYIWTPGYWAWGPDGYYWVPGTWVRPPRVGLLWTPGYWGWAGGVYAWHAGYWGPHVGFYGGINYGFGYTGVGFVGGEWRGGIFAYNTAVTNVNVRVIHTTYVDRTVIRNVTVNRVSYNGGAGGLTVRPTRQEQMVMRERHIPPSSVQMQHEHAARGDRNFLASVNRGRPAIAATPHANAFHGGSAVAARPSEDRGANVPRPPSANNRRGNMVNERAMQNNRTPRPSNTAYAPDNHGRPSNDRQANRNDGMGDNHGGAARPHQNGHEGEHRGR